MLYAYNRVSPPPACVELFLQRRTTRGGMFRNESCQVNVVNFRTGARSKISAEGRSFEDVSI